MAKYNVKILRGSIEQTLDFKEIFGVSFVKNRAVKERIAQALIDKMKDRIAAGVDRFGEEMAPYSKVYKESFDYIAARKNETVNMRLTGDMLGSIDILESAGSLVKIGFRGGEQQEKAYGHFVGEGKLPVRQFFGVTESEVEQVKEEFSQELAIVAEIEKQSAARPVSNQETFRALDSLRDSLVNRRARDFFSVVQDED
jgi:hypothetical protein